MVVNAAKTIKGGLRSEADRSQPHLLSETVSLSLIIYGMLAASEGLLAPLQNKFEFTRARARRAAS